MSKWLLLPLFLLPFTAAAAGAAIVRDRDHDGMADRWERRHHVKLAKGDPDRDGLRNRREFRVRTNPHRKDTDRDGLRDGAEVRRYHTNPRRKDTDGDGLRDRAEIRRYHTNPRKKDTDGDGYSDGREVRAGTDPKKPHDHPPHGGGSTPPPSSPPPSGWPGPSNTGVPAGTALTPSGGLTINTAGTVINARDITGQVVVNAANVTIRNSRIRSNAMWAIDNNSTGLVVEDSEIINRPVAGQPNCHNGIGNSNLTVRRTEITGCENSLNIDSPGNVTFTDNYVHDLDISGPSYVWGNSPHTDGIQMGAGASNITIRQNWISPQDSGTPSSTSAIIMYTDTGTPQSSVRIEDNYLDGSKASYAVYAPRQPSSNIFINDNAMLSGYGYTACVRLGVTVTEFNGNRDAGSGALIGPDNGAGGSCSN
jgi:hypothetical protein